MRVLLMNQFFWPDSAATSQLLTDLARDLVTAGHEVDVICGGAYAETASEDTPPVTIHRITGLRFKRSTLGRMLSYGSFYLGAALRALAIRRPDVVLTLTTPPLLSVIGAFVKKLRSCQLFIWEMDIYPDIAVDLGYLRKGGVPTRFIGALADWSRRQANGVIALGECMRTRLVGRGIHTQKITTVDNWADSGQIHVLPREVGPKLQIVYSGNLGLAHDIDTVLGAMDRLRDDERFHFTFGGGGARRAELARFVSETNFHAITIRPYVARADLSQILGFGDIGLVTQRDDCCGSVVPSKIYGLMAAGRAILFIGPAAATPAHIVTKYECGWHVPCGDVDALVHLLEHLAVHSDEIDVAGRNARQALEQHFDRPLGTARIIDLLTDRSDVSASATATPGVTSRQAAVRSTQ